MKSRKWFVLASLLISVGMALGACGPAATPTAAPAATQAPAMTEAPAATEAPAMTEAPTQAAGTPADTIIIGTTDSIASFDPADAYSTRDWEVIKNINEGLLK